MHSETRVWEGELSVSLPADVVVLLVVVVVRYYQVGAGSREWCVSLKRGACSLARVGVLASEKWIFLVSLAINFVVLPVVVLFRYYLVRAGSREGW